MVGTGSVPGWHAMRRHTYSCALVVQTAQAVHQNVWGLHEARALPLPHAAAVCHSNQGS